MDTLKAFAIGEMARARGDKMKYYDYEKAIRLMKKYNVKKAGFFMASDKEWTYDELTLSQIKKKPRIAGINGSCWATPMIEINEEELECWTFIEPNPKP